MHKIRMTFLLKLWANLFYQLCYDQKLFWTVFCDMDSSWKQNESNDEIHEINMLQKCTT